MKNSPGSMIGGIGLTTWVRDVQFVADDAHHLVDVGVLDAQDDRRVRLLEEAAGAVESGRAELLVEQGVDEGSRHPRYGRWRRRASPAEYRGRERPWSTGSGAVISEWRRSRTPGVRCALRQPEMRAGVLRVDRRTDQRSPRFARPPPSRRSPLPAPSRRCSTACSPRPSPVSRRRWAPSSSPIPTAPGLQLVASHGMDEAGDARLSPAAVDDPADPFTTAAVSPRSPTFDREATAADGSGFVGAYLPLVVAQRRRRGRPRRDRLRLAGAARPRRRPSARR